MKGSVLFSAAVLLGGLAGAGCRGAPARERAPLTPRERFSRATEVATLEKLVRKLAASPNPADREEALWAVHDHRGKVAVLAVRGLAQSRDARLLPHLFDRLRDPSAPEDLRLACLDALFAFDPALWRTRLRTLLPTLSPESVRKAASDVLDSLPTRDHGSS